MDKINRKILIIVIFMATIIITLLFPIRQGDVFVPLITHLVSNYNPTEDICIHYHCCGNETCINPDNGLFIPCQLNECEEWRSKTECEKGNPDYELITGCPDYECTCNMPRNQSLCRAVNDECIKQAKKLPGEQICVKKIGEFND